MYLTDITKRRRGKVENGHRGVGMRRKGGKSEEMVFVRGGRRTDYMWSANDSALISVAAVLHSPVFAHNNQILRRIHSQVSYGE